MIFPAFSPLGASGWFFVGNAVGPGDGTVAFTGISLQENDIVFACHAAESFDSNPVTPTGWTVIDDVTYSAHEWFGYKIMGASPDSSADFSSSTGAVVAQVWRGVDTENPYVGGSINLLSTSGMPNPPSYTVVNPNALIIVYGALDDDAIASSVTAPINYSNIVAGNANDGATAMLASRILEIAGEENPNAFGGDGNDLTVSGTTEFKLG